MAQSGNLYEARFEKGLRGPNPNPNPIPIAPRIITPKGVNGECDVQQKNTER